MVTAVPADATSVHQDEYACAHAWAALTAVHARVASRLSTALARQCGLALNEFEILLRLDRARGDGVRLSDLLPAVPLTQPALSRAARRMTDRGWLGRSAAPGDGRGILVTITDTGREVLRAAIPVHADTIRAALLDRLTGPDQDLLVEVLRRVIADRP